MEDFISEIYTYAELIPGFKLLNKLAMAKSWELFLDRWNNQKETLASFCRDITSQDPELGTTIWNKCVDTGTKVSARDSSAVSDSIEHLIPLLYDAMQLYGGIDVTENDIRIFSSKSGFLSIEDTSGNLKLSSVDPVWEAYEKAQSLYFPNMMSFYSLGCELGYLTWEMFEISNRSVDIYIYSFDSKMVEYAMSYGVLGNISRDKLHVFVNENQDVVMQRLIDDVTSHNTDTDALINIEQDMFFRLNPQWRDAANDLMTALSTRRNYSHTTQINYYRNRHNVSKLIGDLQLTTPVNDWIIVGGGPSVDECMPLLAGRHPDKVIVATMTIYRKLITNNVDVDYLTVIDPNPRTFKHIKDTDRSNAVLVLTDCADWQYGEYYAGKKYMIPTSGYFFSEEQYKASGVTPWEPLGTVTSMSIELAAYLGAKNIELVGVDLAYPGNKTHADGTVDSRVINTDGMIKVRSVDGGEVYTNHSMDYYRGEIEELIRKHKNINFYNRSKHGAYIEGCRQD